MTKRHVIGILTFSAFFAPKFAFAIVPPDFVTSVSSGLVPTVSLIALILSSLGLGTWTLIRRIFASGRGKTVILALVSAMFVSASAYFLSEYYVSYMRRRAVEATVGAFTPEEKKTYDANRQAMDKFVSELDPRFQEWMRETATVMLTDANAYLANMGGAPIAVGDVPLVDDRTVLRMMDDPQNRAVFLDAREDYEHIFLDIRGTRNIRFGNLLNDDFRGLKKDDEIIVICNTDARSWVVANYLISRGFTNVRTLAGGTLMWELDGLPLARKNAFRFIYDTLPYLDENAVRELEKDPAVREIYFSSFSPAKFTVNTMLIVDAAIQERITDMKYRGGRYIIRCTSHIYCFDAVAFWDRASRAGINFVGYTGYRPRAGDIRNFSE